MRNRNRNRSRNRKRTRQNKIKNRYRRRKISPTKATNTAITPPPRPTTLMDHPVHRVVWVTRRSGSSPWDAIPWWREMKRYSILIGVTGEAFRPLL